jgi:lactate dehydrogenase-like 2-hydroxyacid dehydrogenase
MGYLDKLGTDVHHATLGILGMGRIGAEVARRAVGFNMKILYHNRNRHLNHESEFGAVHVSKEDLLKQSDFVSINLPQTQETLHYIGAAELRLMKSSAILVNTSRGPIVNQGALLEALNSGQIAGAGLDVTDPEPIGGDDPLLALPQVTVLPHVGSATWQTRTKMAEVAARNLINALSGRPMVSCVNPQALGQGRYAELSA